MDALPLDLDDELLTPAKVLERLNVSRKTLWRYEELGHLTSVRLPSGHRRYRRGDVERLRAGTSA